MSRLTALATAAVLASTTFWSGPPAHAAPATTHAGSFVRPHRTGVAVPATTPSSIIDAVVPLHVSAAGHAAIERLANERATASQRHVILDRLLPGRAQRLAVTEWATDHGFKVIGVTAWGVALQGRADRLAAAFGTSLRTTTQQGKGFVTARTAPVVPAALRGLADAVVGLDTRPLFRSHGVYGGGDIQVLNSTPTRGSTAGAGATVATVNLSGWHSSDLTTYRQAAFGTSDTAPTITPVVVGKGHSAATVPEDDFGMDVEVALDAEAIAGVAPSAGQRQYFGSNSSADYLLILQRMAADLVATPGAFQTASTSWGQCELAMDTSTMTQMRSAITAIRAAGATFFAASGDSGGTGCSNTFTAGDPAAVDFPASAEDAVAVGGTTVTGSATTYASTAWSGSGGGCSTTVPAPARQVAVAGNPCHMRAVPDIATLADPQSGFWTFDRIDGWIPVGGTSLAAPSSAAGLADVMADAHLTTLSTPFLDTAYAHAGAFTDVTTGNNGVYDAGVGYDVVTGLGSPVWTQLDAAITNSAAPVPSGHNEPLLAVNPNTDTTTANLQVQVSQSTFLPSLVPNGEPVTGYAVTTGTSDCTATSVSPPQSVPLGSAPQGVTQLSVSYATTDPLVSGGCITASRPIVIDTIAPVVPAAIVTYVGTTSPTYRFSWAAATDGGTGVVLYKLRLADLTTNVELAPFYTVGRAAPYASSPPVKLTPGHVYAVRLEAFDEAFNEGVQAHDGLFNAPFDDTAASKSSGWTRVKASADYLGSHLLSAHAGSYYLFKRTFKTLTAGVIKSRYGGYMDVYVDNVRKARISLYASSTYFRQQIRLATFAAAGTHTVVVKVVGLHQTGAIGNVVYLDSLTVGL